MHKFFENPLVFQWLRATTGDYFKPAVELLELQSGETLLDVCCGVGAAGKLVPPGIEYTGLDIDERYIARARSLNTKENVKFVSGDLKQVQGTFDKALVACMLHHLSSEEIADLGERLAQIVTGPLVVIEGDIENSTLIQRFFLHIDRGDYATRPLGQHLAPLKPHYDCSTVLTRDTNLSLARLTYTICRPKARE